MIHDLSRRQGGDAPPDRGETSDQLLGRRQRDDDSDDDDNGNLARGKRKATHQSDPLVGTGKKFGRTIHAYCRIFPLIKEGLTREIQMRAGLYQVTELRSQELREHQIYNQLKDLEPGLAGRILEASPQELQYISATIESGVSKARTIDIRSTKGAIIAWITPPQGSLIPSLAANRKADRGFFHYRTGELLCPPTLDWTDANVREKLKTGELVVGDGNWPAFVYEGKYDNNNPWDGMWRGELLVKGYKHVFIAPSAAEGPTRGTRAGNAQLHGMRSVTIPSLAYVATLVRFALSSNETMCINDVVNDSEQFYNSVIKFLRDPDEMQEIEELLKWWNLKIFPRHHPADPQASSIQTVPSVVDRIRELRALKNRQEGRRPALADADVNLGQGSGGQQR